MSLPHLRATMTSRLPGIYELFPDLLEQGILSMSHTWGTLPSYDTSSSGDLSPIPGSASESFEDEMNGVWEHESASPTPEPIPRRPGLHAVVSWPDSTPDSSPEIASHETIEGEDETLSSAPPSRAKRYNKILGSRKDTHQCAHCPKRFDRPSSLRTHLLIHSGDTPFVCPISSCAREFNVRSNLRRHIRCHERSTSHEPKTPVVSNATAERNRGNRTRFKTRSDESS